MIPAYLRLAERIDAEVADLDGSVKRATQAWAQVLRSTVNRDFFVDSVALNLHAFYSGAERLFELVARQVDGQVPQGEAWHQALIQQVAEAQEGIRPAVIGPDSWRDLDDYRRFRHLVRNVYADHLDPERMKDLMDRLAQVWARLTVELCAFRDFLRAVSAADDELG